MPSTYNDNIVNRRRPVARALLALNVTLGALVLIGWQFAVLILLDPLSWAANQRFSSGHDLLVLLQYPIILFWLLPAAAVLLGWVAMRTHNYKLAVKVMLAPVFVAVLIYLLYWTLPDGVR